VKEVVLLLRASCQHVTWKKTHVHLHPVLWRLLQMFLQSATMMAHFFNIKFDSTEDPLPLA